MPTIGLREFKAKASQILREVSQDGKEFIITRHGKPCGKLAPLQGAEQGMEGEPVSMRGIYTHLPDLAWEDFQEVKKLWDMK